MNSYQRGHAVSTKQPLGTQQKGSILASQVECGPHNIQILLSLTLTLSHYQLADLD